MGKDIEDILSDIEEDTGGIRIVSPDDSSVSESAVSDVSQDGSESGDIDEDIDGTGDHLDEETDEQKSPDVGDDLSFRTGEEKETFTDRETSNVDVSKDNEFLKEKELIGKSFFFSENMNVREVQEKLRKAMVLYIRDPSRTVSSDYDIYLHRTASALLYDLCDYFHIDELDRELFIAFIGEMSCSSIVSNYLKKHHAGTCYYLTASRNAEGFHPEKYIRYITGEWFRENIGALNLPVHDQMKKERFRKAVERRYAGAVMIFNARYRSLQEKLGPLKTVTKQELLKKKGNEWFGITAIPVYRRFLYKTIFKSDIL